MKWSTLAVLALCLGAPQTTHAQLTASADDFVQLINEIQTAVETADTERFLALLGPEADIEAGSEFARDGLRGGVTGAVAQMRFFVPIEDVPEGTSYQLLVEVFTETGRRGRLQTWALDVQRGTGGDPGAWQVARADNIDSVEGLYNLALDPDTQYDATNLVIAGEDLTLRMTEGSVFVSENAGGVTGLVLLGDGVMTFSPEPEAERGQMRIFAGSETLEAEFTEAYIRFNPETFGSTVSTSTLVETRVDTGELERAREIFDEFAPLSFAIDLSDLSDRAWWLNPGVGDFVGEIRTNRYGTLTYAQAQNQPEDVTLYERDGPRIIALYPSARKRAVQGRYYSDQDAVSYDVLDYDIEASIEPRGIEGASLWSTPRLRGSFIQGSARLAVRVTGETLSMLTLRLADNLAVHSVTSSELGPLLYFRMAGQNDLIVNLPGDVPNGTEFAVVVAYSGFLESQELDENWIGRQNFLYDDGRAPYDVGVVLERSKLPEHRYLYSNSSYWYPQSSVSDYATATMELTVPAEYGVVASGEPEEGNPPPAAPPDATGTSQYSFVTVQPARYLSIIISRFAPGDVSPREVAPENEVLDSAFVRSGVSYNSLSLNVESNERTRQRIEEFYELSTDILRFYMSLVGDVPYPTFTLALTDSFLPGGHSPAHFAVLNQPLPLPTGLRMSWRADPVAFSGFRSFFLAHELAHQWWGQAVGWKNYHEQWLSEGLAQYFAALYAQEEDSDGDEVFADVISQMRRWSMRHSGEGPVYLGNRLGHIEDESRVFRSLVYNKGAMVLHMLRRLIGDEVFFNGLRRFYNDMRFQMAGTDDLIRAFEIEAKRSLEDFFDRWIHESDIPRLRFDYRTEARLSGQTGETDVVLRFEQGEKLFEVPITVTLRYRNGQDESIIVPVSEQVTEVRVPLTGRLRDVDVNEDNAALAEIDR